MSFFKIKSTVIRHIHIEMYCEIRVIMISGLIAFVY